MRSALARRLAVPPPGSDPALWRFAGECSGFLGGLTGYMGALALIAIAAAGIWDHLQLRARDSVPFEAGANTLRLTDSPGKAEVYQASRLEREWSRQVSLLG